MAVIRTSNVDLKVNGSEAYAYVAQPDDEATHPGLVLIQEWWGIESHIIELAQRLAADGFVVAVPDLYHGKVSTEPSDAMKGYMTLTSNVAQAVAEISGALNTLKAHDSVAPKKLGIMGFCVGGFLTYKTAESYADLGAVVSFYGGGYDPTPEDAAKVTAPVLAIYGSLDTGISAEARAKVEEVYKAAGKDITVKVYEAGHAFTNPDHGMGNAEAAADAWAVATKFLKDKLV